MFSGEQFWEKKITMSYSSSETERAGIPTLGINLLVSP